MAKYLAESGCIASIYPGKLEQIRKAVTEDPRVADNPGRGCSTVYWLPPVSRAERRKAKIGLPAGYSNVGWTAIEITDVFELIPAWAERDETGKLPRNPKPVRWQDIAQNLVTEWCGNMPDMPPGAGPGIMIIANTAPSQGELEQMAASQTAMYNILFSEGSRLHSQNRWREISQPMRDAAIWLGHEGAKWVDPGTASQTPTQVQCPACREFIAEGASLCRHCGTRLKALPAEVAALNPGLAVPIG